MVEKIHVFDKEISLLTRNSEDYICITDIARYKEKGRTDHIIQNWMRNRNTLEFLGIWEQLNNPDFKPLEFEGLRNKAGLNSFVLTPGQWIDRTGAIGIFSKAGRYGGTYAHKDIAFEFASWISVGFKLYLIKEFQRLKEQEREQPGWDIKRNLARINYRIHTDAIKEVLIPKQLAKRQVGNVYANVSQLVCLSNLENLNALFINEGISQKDRLLKLNAIAIHQMKLLTTDNRVRLLDGVE
ncbi:MAG: KilA-N domain-containing protein [Candidatus Sabulitectum sp.]|nr:KilA-N domain-containing protein [Candidatus Sabulitectum sp.]